MRRGSESVPDLETRAQDAYGFFGSAFCNRSCGKQTLKTCNIPEADARECLLSTADSTDRCNGLVESFSGCFEV
jgi:hypothetical protein